YVGLTLVVAAPAHHPTVLAHPAGVIGPHTDRRERVRRRRRWCRLAVVRAVRRVLRFAQAPARHTAVRVDPAAVITPKRNNDELRLLGRSRYLPVLVISPAPDAPVRANAAVVVVASG